MTKENKKSALRTIRLSKGLDELLQKDANARRISIGALISAILTKYSEWDRYMEKFDMITLRQEAISAILEATEDEIWKRIKYFLERVSPIAEESGVKLACHPDDPPVPKLKGETRVLGSLEGLKKLLNIVPSPANGLNFCQGTIAEMGVDVIEAIRYFGSRKKINHVHFRNVCGSLPSFEESFIDDGDVDMLDAMRAYKEVGYIGTIMPDHTPRVEGDTSWGHRGRAFALGYIKALMKATKTLDK